MNYSSAERQVHLCAGIGFLLFIILKTCGDVTVFSVSVPQLASAIGGPFFLFIFGYLYTPSENFPAFIHKTLHSAAAFLIPLFTSTLLDTLIYFWIQPHLSGWSGLKPELKRLVFTLFFMSRDTLNDVDIHGLQWINGIGVFWVLWTAFVVSLLYDALMLIIKRKIPVYFISTVLGIVGTLWSLHTTAKIPLELNVVLICMLFFTVGIIWRDINDHTNNRSQLILTGVSLLLVIVCILSTKESGNIASGTFTGVCGDIILPVAFSALLLEVSHYLIRYEKISELASILGRHLILMLVMHHFDGMMVTHWQTEQAAISIILRLSVIIGTAEVLLQGIHLFIPLKSCKDDKRIFLRYRSIIAFIFLVIFFIAFLYEYTGLFHYMMVLPSIAAVRSVLEVLYHYGIVLCILVTGISLSLVEDKLQMAIEVFVFFAGLIVGMFNVEYSIFAMFMLVTAATGKSFRKMLWIAFIIGSSVTITAYHLSMTGIIPYHVTVNSGGHMDLALGRHNFGTAAPVEASAHVLYLTMMWCVLKSKKQSILAYIDYIPMFIIGYFTYRYTDARANFIWTMLLISCTLLYQLLSDEPIIKQHFISLALRIFNFCQIFVYLVCLGLSYGVSFIYRDDKPLPFEMIIGKAIDLSTLRMRFRVNSMYLKAFKPWLLGSILVNPTALVNDYYIDVSYIRILILYGTLTFFTVIILITYTQYQHYRHKNYYLMFVLSIVALNSMMEQHLTIFQINVFIFTAFSTFNRIISTRGKSRIHMNSQ